MSRFYVLMCKKERIRNNIKCLVLFVLIKQKTTQMYTSEKVYSLFLIRSSYQLDFERDEHCLESSGYVSLSTEEKEQAVFFANVKPWTK